MGVTDHGLVIGIDFAITVVVMEDEITRFRYILAHHVAVGHPLINLRLVLEDTEGLVTPEVTHRIAHLHAERLGGILRDHRLWTMDDALAVCQAKYLIGIVCHVERQTIGEISANLVIPGERQLHPLVLHVTPVDVGGTGTVKKQCGSHHEPVFGGFPVPVEVDAQL